MIKVLHLPLNIAGTAAGLAQVERKLGYDSRYLDINSGSKFKFKTDLLPVFPKAHQFGFLGKAFSLFMTFLKIRNDFDIYHFNFGHTLLDYAPLDLNYLDLPLYPKGKKLFMTYNGCDVRQPISDVVFTSDKDWTEENSYNHFYPDPKEAQRKRKRAEIVDRYVHGIFAYNPDLLRFLPDRAQFVPYILDKWDEINPIKFRRNDKIRILHAPSNKTKKGTEFILEAMSKIQKNYTNIEFILVENLSNAEALALYQTADLVIDQLLVGWYGTLAVECMKMGKPVMVFIREEDLKYIPQAMQKDCMESFIVATPRNIYQKIGELVENPMMLDKYSTAALDYVHRWHDPIKIGHQITSLY